jgi:pimeloyl-ACP methyl ester carboxylesterase
LNRRVVVALQCAWVVLTTILVGGCALPFRGANPSFPVTEAEAKADLARMVAAPVRLERPLVVLAGIGDPSISSDAIMRGVAPTVLGTVLEIDFFTETSFEGSRRRLMRELSDAFGGEGASIPEVDVIAFSMGGLIARDAAIPDRDGRQLRIRRLFTISAPHEGARLAGAPLGVPLGEDMIPTSDFIARLRQARRGYELVCYTRLDDVTVGEEFAAPDGEPLWWVPTPSGEWSHMAAFADERILADIARRIRGERPLTRPPASPLPL